MDTQHYCNMLVNIFVIFLIYFLAVIASSDILLQENPTLSLACKMYETSKIDCSHRKLLNIPVLDKNLTTVLDLSNNQLEAIHGSPFRNLTILESLDLSTNGISQLDPDVFKGLVNLLKLDLHNNRLQDLPGGIFSDLHKLIILDMRLDVLSAVPPFTFAVLNFLKELYIETDGGSSLDTLLRDLQTLNGLKVLNLATADAVITKAMFEPLIRVQELMYFCDILIGCYIDDLSFGALASLTTLITNVEVFSALTSIRSPLQYFHIASAVQRDVFSLNSSTFQHLLSINESLRHLCLENVPVYKIQNYSFRWMPNLVELIIVRSQVQIIEQEAFYGLKALKKLDLHSNQLVAVPSNAIRHLKTLYYLDLSVNKIKIRQQDMFCLPSSVIYLNIANNYLMNELEVNIRLLLLSQNLEQLVVGWIPYHVLAFDWPFQLSSLHVFEDKDMFLIFNNTTLCFAFPYLTNIVISDAGNKRFDFQNDLVLHECSELKTLDLSGSAYGPKSLDHKHINISIPSLEELNLARSEFETIDQVTIIKSPNLIVLNLTDNKIKTIDSKIAIAFRHLVNLYIDGNDLVSLSGLELLTTLKYLNAARNQITQVPSWLLSSTIKPVLFWLDLQENPFSCLCEMEQFQKWILYDTDTWLEPGQYICASPDNFTGVSVSDIVLHCMSYRNFYIGIGTLSGFLFIIMIIFLVRYQWHIKYKLFLMYRNYLPFPDNDEEFEMLQLHYNAYVAYNEMSDDDNWVFESLQPNMEEGPEPLKLCIRSRDFIPGSSLIDSISESIQLSHKTILILSPNFVESEWCYHEMEMSQMRLLEENLDVLVLVLLQDIPNDKITLSLRKLLCKKDFIRWPTDRAGQKLFWRRLRVELKAPAQVDRRYCM